MNNKQIKRLKAGCYATNVTMAAVCNLSPILFLTFHSLYDISYTLLGTLVLINFVTQLIVDLIFSFFSHRFNIPKVVKFTPVLAVIGLIVYTIAPMIMTENIYLGLALGTIIFSSSSGLAEVLISPVIAAIPSENPDREMSKLHSVYAWGAVGVILISTVFLVLAKHENWQFLPLIFALIPALATILFAGSKIPEMVTPGKVSGAISFFKRPALWLCVLAIFLGGASECTMAQWCSGYLEQAVGLPKFWGDLLGVAVFSFTLGLGRSLYAKNGKNIGKVLFFGAIGASACYITAALCSVPLIGLFACAATGFFVSMMWPGSLLVGERKIPDGGVFMFAMMAAGGDLGASTGPQLVGYITDTVIAHPQAGELAEKLSLNIDQLGMKTGMLFASLFPLGAIVVYGIIYKSLRKSSLSQNTSDS